MNDWLLFKLSISAIFMAKTIYKKVIMDKKCGSMMGISEEVYITTEKRGYDWYDREILLSNGTSMNRNEPPMDRKSILLSNLK